MYDVIIIGGGVAGLGAAITLGSSQNIKINTLVIDEGNSDLLKSYLYNVPFIKKGTSGKDAYNMLKKDALEFDSVSFTQDTAIAIDGKYGDFTVKCKNETVQSKFIILASGCHTLDIKLNGKTIPTLPHNLLPKEGKIRVETSGRQELEEGLYVAGLLCGVTTMYATALGSGVEASCAILSKINGKTTIIHDHKDSRQ